jgi:hypothetical protein
MKWMISFVVAIALPLMTFAHDSLNIQEIDSLLARTQAYNGELFIGQTNRGWGSPGFAGK